MKRLEHLFLSLALAATMAGVNSVWADNVAIHTPSNFQVLSLSPNGKWACGVFIDGANNTYPFRWNLTGGSIEMLGTEPGTAWDVADDGTVSGDYPDTEVLENHAPLTMPCYWRDGVRHAVEMPAGKVTDGFGGGITPDGKYMVGTICVNGIYTPYIWNEGNISRTLATGSQAVAYAVSPDGQNAAGFNTQYNRTACYWPTEGSVVCFEDSPISSQTPWCYSRNFSPDGTKLVYWGGWELNEDETELSLYAIYDLTTGQRKKVMAPSVQSDLEFFDISNNEMLVGYNQGRGFINTTEHGGMYIDDYLALRNVDLRAICDDFYSGTDFYQDQLPVSRVVAVSEDENVFALNYYNTIGEQCSMVLKIDQDLSAVAPAECKAEQLAGVHAVSLTWKRPVGTHNIRGYNVYSDGIKLNLLPVGQLYYYDMKATLGDHVYTIAAVTTAGVETMGEAMAVSVTDAPLPAPYSLLARQKGACAAFIDWKAPLSNMVHKRYYSMEQADISGFTVYEPITVELAIRYAKGEMAAYAGHKIKEVSFIPMGAHNSWKVNIYTYNAANELQLLYSEPVTQQLTYGRMNTVTLAQPQDVPNGELVVAIEVDVNTDVPSVMGVQAGPVVPGYSDLLRMTSEPDMYSAYDRSLVSGLSLYHFSWGIDVGMEPADGTPAQVEKYNIYLDNNLIDTATGTKCEIPSLKDGTYAVAVEAQYDNGQHSELCTGSFTIAANYPKVENVAVKVSETDASEVTATWTAPESKDVKDIAHTTARQHTRGLHGNSSTSYAFMIASDYQPKMLRGYDGYHIKGFKFYPLSDAIFTFYLLENGKIVCEQEVEDDLVYGQWNTCLLDEELVLNENSEYRLVIDCFDPEPEVDVFALDGNMPLEYVSDLVSTDGGQTWMSLYNESSSIGNFMMGMVLEAPEADALAIDGYDVVIDGNVVNDGKLAATSFTRGSLAEGSHSLKVNTYYSGTDTAVEGNTTTFTIDLTAISQLSAEAAVSIQRGIGQLHVEGKAVRGLALFTADGTKAAQAAGSTIATQSLPAGVYILKIDTHTGSLSRKVVIY